MNLIASINYLANSRKVNGGVIRLFGDVVEWLEFEEVIWKVLLRFVILDMAGIIAFWNFNREVWVWNLRNERKNNYEKKIDSSSLKEYLAILYLSTRYKLQLCREYLWSSISTTYCLPYLYKNMLNHIY
jgi:hypothetical protein